MVRLRRQLLVIGALATALTSCTRPDDGAVVEGPVLPLETSTTAPAGTSSTTTSAATTTTTAAATTTEPATTSTTATPTTTTEPLPAWAREVADPECVVQVQPGETIPTIVARYDDDILTDVTVRTENGLAWDAEVAAGTLLDVCVDNGLNDIDGSQRVDGGAAVSAFHVEQQQRRLNELFAGLGFRELLVDGVSGPVTRQRLCAFRLSHNLPVSLDPMEPGSPEEQELMGADSVWAPWGPWLANERWVLVDQTCQVMFTGEKMDRLVNTFPVSTGLPEFHTRLQAGTAAYRYNPADHNDGWHDSLTYPAADDNPLNGNMYRPLYFDRGQAIHGANNVPTSPQSHGCVRLRVGDQETLLAWLGLLGGPATWSPGEIDARVWIQGGYSAPAGL